MLNQTGDIVAIAANPYSGARGNRELVEALAGELRSRGIEPVMMWEKAALAAHAMDSAFVARCRCVVAAGGDGTILHVINAQSNLPLVHYPLGNENLFAGHFGVTADPAKVADMIEAGRTVTIDLGRVTHSASQSHVPQTLFTCVASAGFDAEVVRRLDAWRNPGAQGDHWRRVKRATYLKPITAAAFGYRYPMMTVTTADGRVMRGTAVFVFNLPRYGMGLSICPDAIGDDGLLDYVVFERPGSMRLIGLALSVKRGRHLARSDVHHGRAKRITIESDSVDVPVELDGDPGGVLPIALEAMPAALRVVVPGG